MSRGIKSKECDIDLGLAVSALSMEHGKGRTCQELADFCGCSPVNIHYYEKSGLDKLRKALRDRKNPILVELIDNIDLLFRDRSDPYAYTGVIPEPVYNYGV